MILFFYILLTFAGSVGIVLYIEHSKDTSWAGYFAHYKYRLGLILGMVSVVIGSIGIFKIL